MDFNTFLQLVIAAMTGALSYFLGRYITKTDKRLDQQDQRIDEIKKEFHAMKEDMPLVYTLREDFLRVMNNVDEKLNKILYSKNGGNGND